MQPRSTQLSAKLWPSAEQAKTAAFDPATLTEPNRRERAYLLAALENDLFWIAEAEWPFRNPAWYLVVVDPEIYLSKP